MVDSKPSIGTSDMPAPQIMHYEKIFKITDLFKRDLNLVLKDVAYADAKKYLDILDMYPDGIPIAPLNEFIRMLGYLPYKHIAPLMKALDNKDNFQRYFVEQNFNNN